MTFLVKYNPNHLNEVVFADQQTEEAIKTLCFMKKNQDRMGHGHYILYGPYGSGKSSLARLLAYEFEPTLHSSDVVEISKTSKADEIRTKLKNFSSVSSLVSHTKFVLIDELDQLSPQAQQVVQQYTADTKFSEFITIIATTNHLNKVMAPLRSRLVSYIIDAAPHTQWIQRAMHILDKEGVAGVGANQVAQLLSTCPKDNRKYLQALEKFVGSYRYKQHQRSNIVALQNQPTELTFT